MRILALDFGAARTGVAVCDETETLATPLTVVEQAAADEGIAAIGDLARRQGVGLVVVGLPVSLDAREHRQARATRDFVKRLSGRLEVPVVTYDERFTTKVARERGGKGAIDARAAALILEDYLRARSR